MVAEDGTNSILDIEHTGKSSDFGVAMPMPARVSGSSSAPNNRRTNRSRNWGDASERLDRWEAYYLIVYKEGKPHENAFIGCSGD